MKSNLLKENEEYIKDAINSGIDKDAVSSTLTDVLEKSNMKSSNPTQLRNTILSITKMKDKINNTVNKNYVSNLVRENSEKIKSALNDGISSEEIANSLTDNLENKKQLKFIVKLITKMKKKELKLIKEKDKGKQKILANNN